MKNTGQESESTNGEMATGRFWPWKIDNQDCGGMSVFTTFLIAIATFACLLLFTSLFKATMFTLILLAGHLLNRARINRVLAILELRDNQTG